MKLGIIGGSGLYQIEGFSDLKTVKIETPFGHPSDEYITGKLNGAELVFLPRHGKGHTILPGELNHRANIFGMKKLGVTHIISISAVGSLKENLRPKDIVIPEQYFDRTKKGVEHTFFGNGIVAHIGFGSPVCPKLAEFAKQACDKAISQLPEAERTQAVLGGTYVNMEGPAFSTKAESLVYRSYGHDIIGMTNLGEAKLAREAEIAYCTVAMVTDYDCWHPDHDHVTVELVIENFHANVKLAKFIVASAASMAEKLEESSAHTALAGAIITNPQYITKEIKERLAPIIGKYTGN